MKFLILLMALLLLIFSQVTPLELLSNGDFEEPLTNGWGEVGTSSYYTISRGTHYDPDPDYEVNIIQGTGSGFARLYQIVSIPSTDIDFSANAKLYSWDNDPTGPWASASVVISYLNEMNMSLGETYICSFSDNCPWSNTPTTHIIEVSDSSWHNYSFNIDNELINVSGVDPQDIKKLRISVYTENYHC